MRESWKPEQKASSSGSYELVNANGTKTGFRIKLKADDRFPPADKDGQTYVKSSN